MEELKEKLEDKSWVLDLRITQDSGGQVIEVLVNTDSYPKSDPIDRHWKSFPVCIMKVPPRPKKKKVLS